MSHRRKEESGNKLRRNFGMIEPDGEALLLGDPHRMSINE
jgi:acetyl-CoA carboxylase alpha subunit